MAEALKQISCSPECGFMIRSHDENEVISMTSEHIEMQHPDMKEPSADELKAMMTEAPEM